MKLFEKFVANQYSIINEARKESVTYFKTKDDYKKEAKSESDVKVILADLTGSESGVVTKWAKELNDADEAFKKAKKTLDGFRSKSIEIDDQYFDIADGAYKRVLRTAQYIVKFAKYSKDVEQVKSLKEKPEIEATLKSIKELISKQAPEIKDQIETLVESMYELKESKEVRRIASVEPIEEGVVDTAKSFLKTATQYVNAGLKNAFTALKSFFIGTDKDLEKVDHQLKQLQQIIQKTKKNTKK